MHIDRWKTGDGAYKIPAGDGKFIHYPDAESALTGHFFNFCGCGDSIRVLEWMCGELRKVDKREFPNYDEEPQRHFALYVFDAADFIEHGTSIRCAWLTEKGKEWLQDAEEWLSNEEEEPHAT